jgi:hypothetical protein
VRCVTCPRRSGGPLRITTHPETCHAINTPTLRATRRFTQRTDELVWEGAKTASRDRGFRKSRRQGKRAVGANRGCPGWEWRGTVILPIGSDHGRDCLAWETAGSHSWRSNLVLPRCRTDLGPGRHTQFSAANCPPSPRAQQNQQTKENRTAESLNGLSGAIKNPSSMSVSFFPHFVSQLASYPTSAVRLCAGASFCVCLPFPTPSPLGQSIDECSYPVYHGKRPFGRLNPQPTPPFPTLTLRRGNSWVVADLSCGYSSNKQSTH